MIKESRNIAAAVAALTLSVAAFAHNDSAMAAEHVEAANCVAGARKALRQEKHQRQIMHRRPVVSPASLDKFSDRKWFGGQLCRRRLDKFGDRKWFCGQ